MNIQDVYDQAASVAAQTGVDPSIVATISSTESNLGKAPPFTLGITTQAVRGGAGSSGGTLGSSSPYAGSSQPAGFWSYQDGAEAAVAFAEYIHAYQPGLAPLLGDATAFFDPSGPIASSNYYVPTPGGTSTADYYGHWLSVASSLEGAPILAGVGGGDVVQTSAQPASSPALVGGGMLWAIGGVLAALWAIGEL